MQIPPASITSVASSTVATTSNAQKMQPAASSTEATMVTNQDVAELSHGNADRDAQGQGDGLPGKRGNKAPKKEIDPQEAPSTAARRSTSGDNLSEAGGLDLWG